MNLLDKYRFKKRLKGIGKFSWSLLVAFSKVVIFLFFFITAMTFWINIAIEFLLKYEVNFFKPVLTMLWIVVISIMLVAIDIIRNLKIK